jgi:hypothetical protein
MVRDLSVISRARSRFGAGAFWRAEEGSASVSLMTSETTAVWNFHALRRALPPGNLPTYLRRPGLGRDADWFRSMLPRAQAAII